MRGKMIDGVSNAYLRWSTPDVALNDVTRTTPGLDGPTHEEAKTLTETTVSVPTSFADLGVREDICQALEGVGIVSPFPIQAMSIPIAVEGTDLIGQARTGTGKTLAFGITILQRITLPGDEGWEELTTKGKPQALVMCPTRELALQVSKDISTAASVRGTRVLTVYGGVGYESQIDALKAGVDVVVGTPGRLLDLSQRKDLDLSHVRIVVLDEADEMLDLGFLPDVENLIGRTPASRQTMLFSATMPAPIMALARSQLRRPVHVRAEGADTQTTVPDTQQFVYQAHPSTRLRSLDAFCRPTTSRRSLSSAAPSVHASGFLTTSTTAVSKPAPSTVISRRSRVKRRSRNSVMARRPSWWRPMSLPVALTSPGCPTSSTMNVPKTRKHTSTALVAPAARVPKASPSPS